MKTIALKLKKFKTTPVYGFKHDVKFVNHFGFETTTTATTTQQPTATSSSMLANVLD